MFEDLRNTGDDHFGASSGLIPEHSPLINLEGGDEDGDSDDVSSEEEKATPPPKGKGKRIVDAENDKGKMAKTSAGQWMQYQVSKMVVFHERSAMSVESMVARKEETKGLTIVKECGGRPLKK
jgi:hypothetical protein